VPTKATSWILTAAAILRANREETSQFLPAGQDDALYHLPEKLSSTLWFNSRFCVHSFPMEKGALLWGAFFCCEDSITG
jgi:hypothetical protein